MDDWQDLSDSELRQRLERKFAGDRALVADLVRRRDEEQAARTITAALRYGVFAATATGLRRIGRV